MPTTYSVGSRNTMLDALAATVSGGTLELQTSGGAVLGSATIAAPAFPASVGGVITANAIPLVTITTAGTVAKGVFKTSGGTVQMTADVTVTAGTGAIKLSRVDYLVGEAVNITSLTITQAAEG